MLNIVREVYDLLLESVIYIVSSSFHIREGRKRETMNASTNYISYVFYFEDKKMNLKSEQCFTSIVIYNV